MIARGVNPFGVWRLRVSVGNWLRQVEHWRFTLRVGLVDLLLARSGFLRLMLRVVALLVLVALSTETGLSAQDQYALVVTGAAGGSTFGDNYDRWRSRLVTTLRAQPMFEQTNLVVLAERPGPDVGRSSREGVRQAIERLAARMSSDSVLYVVLIGHGSFDGVDAKFNLVGPDLEAREWAALLGLVPGHVVFVNTTGASFPFLERLSSRGNTIVTATRSNVQRFETIFPQFFVEALANPLADTDKSGRSSVLEVFEFASSGVREWYRERGRLATERALLDDNGDGLGREAGQLGPDGAIAGNLYPGAGPVEPKWATNPRSVPLIARREALRLEVGELKASKHEIAPAEYHRKLELLLIRLARVSRQIRVGAVGK